MGAFLTNKLALVGTAITIIVLVAVVGGPWLSPYSPTDADFLALLSPPNLAHPFGTDS
ncbi:MAG: peptide/nickel transport system permease protein, partial [Hyphomicrobiales bacterium]